MGSCTSKQSQVCKSFSVFQIPEFTYVDRKSSQVLSVSPSGTQKLQIDLEILPNSILAYHLENSLFLLGGQKPNRKFSKKCYRLDLASETFSRIQSLPKRFLNAEVVSDESHLFLITLDGFSMHSYSIQEDCWSALSVTFNESNLARLKDFGCCMLNDSLMVVGGRYSSSDYSNDIYCVGVHKPGVPVFRFDLKFPGNLMNPKAICTKQYKIVGGGLAPDSEFNKKFFVKTNNQNWIEVECPGFKISESYPCVLAQGVPVFISGFNIVACFGENIVLFLVPGVHHLSEDSGKKERSNKDDKTISKSISDISGSYVLRGKILTPVNQTFRETISSYDSDFSSQRLDDLEPEIIGQEDTGKRSLQLNKLRILNEMNSAEIPLDFEVVQNFLLFLVDLFKIKTFKMPNSKNFTLHDLEKVLSKLKYKLYPIDTFKIIIKSLDILFAMKKTIEKDERNMLKKIAEINKGSKTVSKQNLLNAIVFRIKLAVVGVN